MGIGMGSCSRRGGSAMVGFELFMDATCLLFRSWKLKFPFLNRFIKCLQWNKFLFNPSCRDIDIYIELGRTSVVGFRRYTISLTQYWGKGCWSG